MKSLRQTTASKTAAPRKKLKLQDVAARVERRKILPELLKSKEEAIKKLAQEKLALQEAKKTQKEKDAKRFAPIRLGKALWSLVTTDPVEAKDKEVIAADIDLETLKLEKLDLNSQVFICNPSARVRELSTKIQHFIAEIEEKYPVGQSTHVRKALRDLAAHHRIILATQQTADEKIHPEVIEIRKYFELCGLISTIRDEISANAARMVEGSNVEANGVDRAFQRIAEVHFDKIHKVDDTSEIDIDGQLEYRKRQLKQLTFEELTKQEEAEYQQASEKLRSFLEIYGDNCSALACCFCCCSIPIPGRQNLYKSGMHLLQAIQEERDKAGSKFDIKFRTGILNTVTELLLGDPNNARLETVGVGNARPASAGVYAKFNRYIQAEKIGQPSSCKKVLGALCMLAGCILIVAGFGLAASTFGVSLPVSAPILWSVGGGLLLSGIALFINGTRKGISRDMSRIEKDTNSNALHRRFVLFDVLRNFNEAQRKRSAAPAEEKSAISGCSNRNLSLRSTPGIK